MKKKYYIFVLTFLCLLCGQLSYGFDDEGNDGYTDEYGDFDWDSFIDEWQDLLGDENVFVYENLSDFIEERNGDDNPYNDINGYDIENFTSSDQSFYSIDYQGQYTEKGEIVYTWYEDGNFYGMDKDGRVFMDIPHADENGNNVTDGLFDTNEVIHYGFLGDDDDNSNGDECYSCECDPFFCDGGTPPTTDPCPFGDYCDCYGIGCPEDEGPTEPNCNITSCQAGFELVDCECKKLIPWYLDNDGDKWYDSKTPPINAVNKPEGKYIDIETSLGVDCDDNKYHPKNNCSVLDPCALVKAQIANATWLNQLNILRGKTGLTNESGYAEQINTEPFFPTLISNGNDHLTFSITKNMIGYMHTHLDPYEITDPDGEIKEVKPIQMFSPDDIINFLDLLLKGRVTQKPLEDIYGVMVSSTGTYELKFTGNIDDVVIARVNIASMKERKIEAAYKKAMLKHKDNEGGFLDFIQNTFKLSGIELMAIGKDNSVSKVTKGVDGKGVKTPCKN